MFSNAKNVEINGKTVKSIILENGGILYKKLATKRSVMNITQVGDYSEFYTNSPIPPIGGTLTDDDGVSLANKTIKLFDGETLITSYTTGSNGRFIFILDDLSVGTHTLQISYEGDENYAPSAWTRTITITEPYMTLTSNKSVLSYYDNESAIITAKVHANNNMDTITFTVNGTVTSFQPTPTNEVSFTYASQGIGDVVITAECGDLQETYELEDCIFYSTTETECTSSNNYITVADLSNLPLPNSFELTFDYKTNGEARCGLFSKSNFTGNPNYSVFIGSPNGSKWYYGYRTNSTFTTDISNSPKSYSTYMISRDGSTFRYKKDSSPTYTKSVTWFDNYNYVFGMMGWGSNLISSVKNIKLKKPLEVQKPQE